jgi:hypothetical protein
MLAVSLFLLSGSLGCHHNLCQQCGGHGSGGGGTGHPSPVARLPHNYDPNAGPYGPPTATYAYPYYTTRAPRDFLQDNPMSIGP